MTVFLEHDWYPRALPPNVKIGERSWLYSAVAFQHYRSQQPLGLSVGHDSGIYMRTFFDLGTDAEVQIGNYCTVVGAVFCTNARVSIQDYVLIAHEVVIADFPVAVPGRFDDERRADASGSPMRAMGPSKPIFIGENAWIGMRAIILGGAHIGEGAIVGAGAVVDCVVTPYSIVAGNPAVIVGQARQRQ